MKQHIKLPVLLRLTILAALFSGTSAFSVFEDLLAFPQYEIRFLDDWVSEQHASSRLAGNEDFVAHKSSATEKPSSQDPPSSQISQYRPRPESHSSADDGAHSQVDSQFDYEQMMLEGQRWLCRVPRIQKVDDSKSAVNETLTKAEEERELARANDRGWELLASMHGNCLYYISGWWSYRFCYNDGVRQFHQVPPTRGTPHYPPVEDSSVQAFVLGKYERDPATDDEAAPDEKWESGSALEIGDHTRHHKRGDQIGELVQRGENRYLVQYLSGGTKCDLTGKDRRIEVQFHCNPQGTDQISLIKETSTCHYLMVVQTPRLCNDVAFLPPKKDEPNAITCTPVLTEAEVPEFEQNLELLRAAEREEQEVADAFAAAAGADTDANAFFELVNGPSQVAGGILIGGHALVPRGSQIKRSEIVKPRKKDGTRSDADPDFHPGKYLETLATSGGKRPTAEQLERFGVTEPKSIERLLSELQKRAGGLPWKLAVFDTPDGPEFRGILGDDGEEDEAEETPQTAEGGREAKKEKTAAPTQQQQQQAAGGADRDEHDAGSEEEYYRDEL